jgi:cytoplasmic iron level regulating protein YaaA (DUF328/UPF0246 family)
LQSLNEAGPIHVTLIACSATKLNHAAAAQHLYAGELFKKSKAFAETSGKPYFILSALHGLVEPDRIIAPYNVTLKTKRKREREAWGNRVVKDIAWNVPAASTITLLAGSDYATQIEGPLKSKGFTVIRPLEGLSIGQQLAALKKAIS